MSNKLKPCPFCGGEAKVSSVLIDDSCFVCCKYCGATTYNMKDMRMYFNGAKDAIAAWNTRAERTCKDLKEFPHLFTCSACGETEYEGLRPNYCPDCGARVVGD